MQTAITQESTMHRAQQHGYRGRVRSGCLTCRSRKVKCDEMRPNCNNCERLKRQCVYKPRKIQQASTTAPSPGSTTLNESVRESGIARSPETDPDSQTYPDPLFEKRSCVPAETYQLHGTADVSSRSIHDPFLSPDSSIVDITARLESAMRHHNEMSTAHDPEFHAASPSTLISRDIELTTTIDFLAARDAPLQASFSFFIEVVDCPWITPYDGVNWRQMKFEVVELGMSNAAVASAIIALSTLYKAQLYGLPPSKALSLYHSSKTAYEELLNDRDQGFGATLAATLILCLFDLIHYQTVPLLKEPSELFIERLETWAQNETSHSGLSSRIIAWLRLFHATTIRGGGTGLISDGVCSLFPHHKADIPNLQLHSHHHSDASTYLYEMLGDPIFEFYLQLQMISGEVAKLTHYHRSRTTGLDQEEIVQQMTQIKSRLHALWESRSATQRQTSEDLRSHLAPEIASPILTLIGVCAAAYHAEFIEIDRILGDPVSESTCSKQAMREIRKIVDGDWCAYDGSRLNSGYLRPLFLYAIECMDHDENQWAVKRLEHIRNPICRSDFFAAFGKALSDAQLRKERRVTSRYFCIRYFGVPPPYI